MKRFVISGNEYKLHKEEILSLLPDLTTLMTAHTTILDRDTLSQTILSSNQPYRPKNVAKRSVITIEVTENRRAEMTRLIRQLEQYKSEEDIFLVFDCIFEEGGQLAYLLERLQRVSNVFPVRIAAIAVVCNDHDFVGYADYLRTVFRVEPYNTDENGIQNIYQQVVKQARVMRYTGSSSASRVFYSLGRRVKSAFEKLKRKVFS